MAQQAPLFEGNIRTQLDQSMPAAQKAHLGTCIYNLINGYNSLLAAVQANNAAAIAALTPLPLPEQIVTSPVDTF